MRLIVCDVCANLNEEVKYQEGTYGSLNITKFGRKTLLIVNFSKCPKYTYCSSKDIPIRMAFEIKYCPNCGAKMEVKQWVNG